MSQHQDDNPPRWHGQEIPLDSSDEFKKLINRRCPPFCCRLAKYLQDNSGEESTSPEQLYQPPDFHYATWEDAPNPDTYSSFGDRGTTASVNMYGEIMQFTKFLGTGDSGMFTVDHWRHVAGPCFLASRERELDRLSRTRLRDMPETYGLQFLDADFQEPPALKYLHYRWPRYEYRTDKKELIIQWMVRDGIVLQQCIMRNLEESEVHMDFEFRKDDRCMGIRDLDYINEGNGFKYTYTDHFESNGPNDCSWTLVHKLRRRKPKSASSPIRSTDNSVKNQDTRLLPSGKADFEGSIAVVVSIFLNGKAVRWTNGSRWTRTLGSKSNGKNTMVVTTAYRMMHIGTSEISWTNSLVPVKFADISELLKAPFSPHLRLSLTEEASEDPQNPGDDGENVVTCNQTACIPSGIPSDDLPATDHIEYIVRRNLEHILSVCSVPLKSENLGQLHSYSTEFVDEVYPIAITCGDISCHRICTSASFFAVWFISSAGRRLRKLRQQYPQDLYVASLMKRISDICRGHFEWLSLKAEKTDGLFVANYWVTGKAAKTKLPSPRIPEDSITDAAFQLLKARECLYFYSNEDDVNVVKDVIKGACKAWIQVLEKKDMRTCSAWPHGQQADTNIFRLDDHVWIWKALSTIEDLELWPERAGNGAMRTSREVQQEMLQRFTTENESSMTRMLAVTRSSRETRFLFHARDTALFYGHDWKFFLQDTPFGEVWNNTVEAQALHSYNQDTLWDNALRYAMAALMGTRNYSINQQSPENLVKWSLQSLFKVVGLNGFCPGSLNKITQKPDILGKWNSWDYNHHASFEIPFILLTNATRINNIYKGKTNNLPKVENPNSPKRQPVASHIDAGDYRQVQKAAAKRQQELAEEDFRGTGSMKKTVPFNRLFDYTTVAEIDEEWLYNYPLFLSTEMEMTNNEITEMLKAHVKGNSDANEHVVTKGAQLYFDRGDHSFEDDIYRSLVADIPKTWEKQEKRTLYRFLTNAQLLEILREPRTAENAAKRFIWLPNATAQTAAVCYLATIDLEKPAISLFLDRHWNQDDYFFDDTTMMTNVWETELHLSFYHLSGQTKSSTGAMQTFTDDVFPSKDAHITKTFMGFRFWGDFFDHYWTCHFIENGTDRRFGKKRIWRRRSGYHPFQDLDNEQGWRQRKVLELYLFERILSMVLKCTREILDEIKSELGVQQGAPSSVTLSSEDYFFSSVQWHKFHNVLEALDEKLESIELEVSKWETRERDRGKEKPRWTRNDERKYGSIIKKLVRSTNQQITNLYSVHASIRTLKGTLMRSQEQIRADLSLRGSEDIRFFTYVTVVFLPLGFASSIFSMNGNPGPDLVISLVICAAVALVITVVALLNAKTLGYFTGRGFRLMRNYSRAKMDHSILMRKGEERKEIKHDEEAAEQTKHGKPSDKDDLASTSPTENTWRFWFLVAYVLLELPARRVAVAYDVLKNFKFSGAGIMNIILGVLFLPICMVSGVMQIAVLNTIDLLRLLFALAIWLNPVPSSPDQVDIRESMRWLVLPFNNIRPLKHLTLQIDKKQGDSEAQHGYRWKGGD